MPEQDVFHILMNGGANAAFAAFLWWQNREQQKRADDREVKQENREKELRDRYDSVIKDLQAREDAMRGEIVKEINDLDKRMSLLEQKLESINKIVEEIKARFVRVG
jgi:chromosome segregation ATPase